MNEVDEAKLLEDIKEILCPYPDACDFILKYTDYVHKVDDIVDEDKDKELILDAHFLALEVYNHPFYLKHIGTLSAIALMAHNCYADSVEWERSDDWRKSHADILRHRGYDMFFCVVFLVSGYITLRRISSRFREYSHNKHLNDIIKETLETV